MAEPRESVSRDYSTGRQHVFHEIEVPGRLPHEPHAIRASAQEHGTKSWTVRVVHGPHEERDPSGSYYTTLSTQQFGGTLSQVKAVTKRAVKTSYRDLMRKRQG